MAAGAVVNDAAVISVAAVAVVFFLYLQLKIVLHLQLKS